MKKIFKILLVMLALGILVGVTGCGNTESNNGGNNQQQDHKERTSGLAWPSNKYTDLIPEPDDGIIYEEAQIDDVYGDVHYVGHYIDLKEWTIEKCKAYAEKLIEAGFNIPKEGNSDVVITDRDTMYLFGASNSDGYYVTASSNLNSGRISIRISK